MVDGVINVKPLTILQISDTHNQHKQLTNLPNADVIVHCGDFTDCGTEEETLDFLNWFIDLPYSHKIFVVGNHDRGCEIEGVRFFGLAYNHPEELIPSDVDVLVTHEPPAMILDESNGTHWGNVAIRNKVLQVKPKYHLFGHAHDAYGTEKHEGVIFSNASSLDDFYMMRHKPVLLVYK